MNRDDANYLLDLKRKNIGIVSTPTGLMTNRV